MKDKTIDLYQIDGFDMAKYIELYRGNVGEKDVDETEPFIPMADFNFRCGQLTEDEYKVAKAEEDARMSQRNIVHYEQQRGVFKDADKIADKCMYLQDALIRRANAKKDTMSFSLSSAMLKAVVGHEYKRMLETLMEMGYLKRGSDFKDDAVKKDTMYRIGEHSTLYTLCCDKVVKVSCSRKTIVKYKEKTKEEYEKMRAKAVEEVDTKYGKPFREHYVTSLRKISVEDEDGLFAYIDQQVKEDPNKYYYYRFVVEGLKDKDKTITKVDRSGRIYHCLTNLERELKQYLNIDYMLDCKNSHPLLFNYFIFKYYNISFSSSYNIVLHLKSISFILTDEPIHNVGKFIRKSLIDNNIENASVARMKDDELEYVWLTSTGRLWDDIATRHEMDRNEVKVQMFQEVFYSNTPYAYHWKEYAVEFKEQFPSVYKRIGMWKMRRQANEVKVYMEGRGLKVDKPTTSLSVAMMDLEAQIFTRVLKRLYAKRWNAVHIHDYIVIPKDGNLNHPSIDQVRTIMEDVFKEFGLSPTLA